MKKSSNDECPVVYSPKKEENGIPVDISKDNEIPPPAGPVDTSKKDHKNLVETSKDAENVASQPRTVHESHYEGIRIFCSSESSADDVVESVALDCTEKVQDITDSFAAVKIEGKSEPQRAELHAHLKEEHFTTSNDCTITIKKEKESSPPRVGILNPPHSPLREVYSSTKGTPKAFIANWSSDLLQAPSSKLPETSRVIIIVWEVTHLMTENRLSAQAYGSAGIAPVKGSDDSIRRGLHDIFDLNLGFQTMNSLSCLKVDEHVLCQRLLIPTGLPQPQLFDHLRARIDLLIRFGLYGNAYYDYQRACLWLATLSHFQNDMTALSPRDFSAPFVLFSASREDVFYPNRVFYQQPPVIG